MSRAPEGLWVTADKRLIIGRALGFPDSDDGLPSSTVADVLETARGWYDKPYSKHIPSMFLDAQKGQPIEVEVILGEVVRLAKERDVNIPVGSPFYGCLS